jgi:dTDP-L-rhamnose 4-epimerase
MVDSKLDIFANKNILVTGGAGFIGSAIARTLAIKAKRYIVLDNLHPQVHSGSQRPTDLDPSAELVVADVTEPATWDKLFASFRPDVIVHLAAETGTGQSLTEASRHALVNVVGTTRMTDALSKHNVPVEHILLTSSRAVYGEGAWDRNGAISYPGQRIRQQLEAGEWDFQGMRALPSSVEATVPHPTSVYGATKYAQEQVLSAWALASKVPLSILRLQNVYGPGQSLTNSYTGIVALFSRLAREGKVIPLYEDGHVTRDFVYISDVADAIIAALSAPPQLLQRFDVGSGVVTTIEQLALQVADYYAAPAPRVSGQFRDGDVRHAMCNIDHTLANLAWKPQVSLKEGIARLQDWIREKLDT